MALNSTDVGNQVVTYDYELPAETEVINKQIYKIVRPGVYDGFELYIEQDDPAQIRVSAGVSYIEAQNEPLGVRLETTADVVLTTNVTPSYPYVIIHYEWYNDPDSFAEIKTIDSDNIEDTDIVLGRALFNGSVLTGFDSDDATHPREYVSNFADTLPLGESATVTSTPTGGTTTNLNGASTDVVEAIQEAFDRLIDLTGVNNDGVKNRHVDFGEGAEQLNGGDFPLASLITTGGTAANISSSTFITAAIQTLASILADLSGANTNSVKERHIDFGTGSTQIDADLLPLGTAITQVISEATDQHVSFANSKLVRDAIADTLSRLSQVSTQVTTNKDNIADNDTDIADLQNQVDKTSNIPVGVIWMYDGSSWQDDVTLPGWYACTPSNSDKGAPDLVDNFIKGGETGTRGSQYAVKGGSPTITLAESQLPPHKHLMTHGHTTKNTQNITGDSNPSHSHTMNHKHKYTQFYHWRKMDIGSKDKYTVTYHRNTQYTYDFNGSTGDTNINHNHAVNIDDYIGYTENDAFANDTITINPQHYKVIYIRKCFQR